ncbi:MAG: hypothetical protein H0W74_06085 [Sphingosinicella sp.]|nr:hypothetical protein [Sphingosinicella sp.]
MIARGFKPVGWVAAVAGAALGCYMLSLNVASERADLASVERQIIAAKQDIRALQTELGTRGRLAQLEHWNADVLALSAPASKQFLQNEFRLAGFSQTPPTIDESAAQVRMASASIEPEQPRPRTAVSQDFEAIGNAQSVKPLVRRASLVVTSNDGFAEQAASPRPPVPNVKQAGIKQLGAKQPVAIVPIRTAMAKVKPAPAKAASAKSAPAKKPRLIDEDVLGEIGAVARLEKQSGGTGAR